MFVHVRKILLPLLCVLALLVVAICKFRRHQREFGVEVFAFNTICSITIWNVENISPAIIEQALMDSVADITNVHNMSNRFDSSSDLSLFNSMTSGNAFSVCDAFMQILSSSRRAYELTDGAFDPTVGPLLRFWKEKSTGENSSENSAFAEFEKIRQNCGFDKLTIDEHAMTVTKTADGLELDFGGIAKGVALDRVKNILEAAGCVSFLLNFGGNIYCSKVPPAGKSSFEIGIRSPEYSNACSKIVHLTDAFVSTSGNYERGRQVPHIINPFSGKPVDALKSVTVITDNGAMSDALSTAVFALGGIPESMADLPNTDIIIE